MVKSVLGFGTFYLPLGFVYTGYVGGLIYTILLTLLYIYGIHLMVSVGSRCKQYNTNLLQLKCMIEARARNSKDDMTMSETVAYAFDSGSKCCRPYSKIFGYLVDILLVVVHFSIGVLYIVFIAQNLKSFSNSAWDNLDIRIFITIVTLCIVPLFLIRDVNYLTPLNITGNILILYIIVFFILSEQVATYFAQGSAMARGTKIINFDVHLYTGFVMFSLSSVGVVSCILLF